MTDDAPENPSGVPTVATGPSDPLAATVAAPATPADLPGAIGRFEIKAKLGEGGMGRVLLARDPDLGRKVALKIVRGNRESPEARERLKREAQGVAQLTHDNVIVVHEVGEHDGQVFVAMEYVEGATLRQRQAGKPWREIVDLYLRAGAGLAAAHRAGLVHRDFKPDNVLVGNDGRVRVTDFGLVQASPAVAIPKTASVESAHSLTQTGAVMGTPRYMAPEQHRGEDVDARADQFAFGVAMFEALYATPPFAGKHYDELSANVLTGRRVPVPASDVPTRVRDAILRALAIDREERFGSMQELLAALAAPARPRRFALAAGAGGLAIAASIYLAVGRRSVEPAIDAAIATATIDAATERPWEIAVSQDKRDRAQRLADAAAGALAANRLDDAERGFQDALALWNHPTFHLGLAAVLELRSGPGHDAIREFDSALAYPEAFTVREVESIRHRRRAKIITLRAREVGEAFEQGRLAYHNKDFRAAAKAFEEAYKIRPEPVFIYDQAASYHMHARESKDYRYPVLVYRNYLENVAEVPDRGAVERVIAVLETGDEAAIARLGTPVLRGVVLAETEPVGATVVVDGKAVGKTPWSGHLPDGDHVIELDLAGYRRAKQTRHVDSSRLVGVTFVLAKD